MRQQSDPKKQSDLVNSLAQQGDTSRQSIQVLEDPQQLQQMLQKQRQAGVSVGLVPTMGYLHQGHATLIRQAAAENDLVVVSVFVNPTQFAPTDDLEAYPRDFERDTQIAAEAGAKVMFHPEPSAMYPQGHATGVSVTGLSTRVEGAARPGHFDGVAQVVLMLLNIVGPNRVYFGEKDWQQVAVVRRMVRDLFVPVEVMAVPTVREDSGLALSSRNTYLSAEQRARASVVSRALRNIQAAYAGGEARVAALLAAGEAVLNSELTVDDYQPDYLMLLSEDLQPLAGTLTPQQAAAARLVFAGRVFGVRLIDNMPLVAQGPSI